MTDSQANLKDLAKSGNPQAIEALVNRSLKPQGITARVVAQADYLQIVLDSDVVPDQASLVTRITRGIKSFNLERVSELRIFGRKRGDQSPAWSQKVQLNQHKAPETKQLSDNGLRSQREPQSDQSQSQQSQRRSEQTPTSPAKPVVRSFRANSTVSSPADWKGRVSLMSQRAWKWYVSGFKAKPDVPLYASPRLHRVLLTLFLFSWITSRLGLFEREIETHSSSSSSSSRPSLNEASVYSTCRKEFTRALGLPGDVPVYRLAGGRALQGSQINRNFGRITQLRDGRTLLAGHALVSESAEGTVTRHFTCDVRTSDGSLMDFHRGKDNTWLKQN